MLCPNCGENIDDNVKFCKKCGQSLSNNKNFCLNCGTANEYGAKFCKNCGNSLNLSQTNKNTEVSDSMNFNSKDTNDPNASKHLAIILLTVIIACIIVLGAVYMTQNNSVDSTNSQNSISSTSPEVSYANGFPVSEVPNLAQKIADSGYSFSTISYGSVTLDKAQCTYILMKAIIMINEGNSNGIIPINSYNYASNPTGADLSQSITKSQYCDMAGRTVPWMDEKGQLSNYVGINQRGVPDISAPKMLEVFSKVMIGYGETGELPASISI